MRINQKKIAELAGVSRGTVSFVINNNPKVNEDTRHKVQKIIRETGYRPNAAARSLAKARTHNIGICFYDTSYISLSFFSSVTQGILEILHIEGYSLMFTTTYSKKDNNDFNIMKPVTEERIDGAIICDEFISLDTLERLQESKFPFVMVNRTIGLNDSMPLVNVDYWRGTEMAVRHLLELGHRRIGLFATHPGSSFREERISAYKFTLDQAGVKFDPNLVYSPENVPSLQNFIYVEKCISRCLTNGCLPTAFICLSDEEAAVATTVLQEHGYHIPRDFSIIGMTDSRQACITRPNITAVSDHTQELGRQAARMLLNIIRGDAYTARRLLIPPEIIIRSSTGPAP